MRSKFLPPILIALLLAPGLAGAATAPAETVTVPESIIARNVPAIPQEGTEDLLPYENLRTANLVDWHPTERRMLIRTRFAESPQLHEVAMPMGARTQLTYYKDPVQGGLYRPGRPGQILFGTNEDGAENFQFFLLDTATGKARRFTDGKSRHVSPVWSHDGKLLAYAGNARNGRDFDIFVADPSTPGSERRVIELKGSWDPLDWSPDNTRLLLSEDVSANESYLHWVDVATGELHTLTPRRPAGNETVAYQGGLWSRDGRSIYVASDLDSEFLRLVRLDVDDQGKPGKPTVVSGDLSWDVEDFDISDDGSLLAFLSNEDGYSRIHVLDLKTGKEASLPKLPEGVAGGVQFRPGSHEIGFSISWARSPSDIYSYDVDSRKLERWTASEAGGLNTAELAVPELVHYTSFDGRKIPAFVYRPPADRFPGPRPVLINIHGGPEGQSRPGFQGSNNYFIQELGVVYVMPNVRGSTGYGKSFLKMDNGDKREESVKDIGGLLDWIAAQPGLDSQRVMVSGGSYGGYMVLASLVHFSDRLCCAFESVGISNFITFLQNTSGYRQDLRRVEYGDERDPRMREFLETIAPIKHVQKMTRPLLVAQGANDPRVPLSESDQIVAALEGRGVPVWYLVGKDEGHGFQKKTNTDYQRAVLVRFMKEFLLGEKAAAGMGSR
jgi:dipeptidyl aminopeptidase/acylaminoacyl peptidase